MHRRLPWEARAVESVRNGSNPAVGIKLLQDLAKDRYTNHLEPVAIQHGRF